MVSNFFQKWTDSKNMSVIELVRLTKIIEGDRACNFRRKETLYYVQFTENTWKIDNFSLANLRCNHQELLSWIIILILNDQCGKIHLYWNFRLHGWKSVNEILLKMSLLNKHIKYLKNKTKEINTGKQFYSYTRF